MLIKCLLGLLKADKGSIEVDGVQIARNTERNRQFMAQKSGMLFQGAALFDSLKVWENVAFRLIYSERKSPKQAREKAIDCLAQVGLAPEVGDLAPNGVIRRYAKTRRPGARDCFRP